MGDPSIRDRARPARACRATRFASIAGVLAGLVATSCGSADADAARGAGRADDPFTFDTAPPRVTPLDLYANDPPPRWCGPAGDAPPTIAGSEACPSDKNKPGCGCDRPGETAPCWTGLRKHRHLGACRDGITRCRAENELSNVWGPCEGQVLPVPEARGPAACSCFSAGEWRITNLAPCIRREGNNVWAMSTVHHDGPSTNCGLDDGPRPPAGTAPAGTWSPSTLRVDCAGTFRLCLRIRGGRLEQPLPTDCILGETCVDADYTTPGLEQKIPDLPTWVGSDSACAKRWELETPDDASPGYAEMIVRGQTLTCESVDDGGGRPRVFHRIPFCPRMCRGGANAGAAVCKACQLAGRGAF